MGCRKLTYYESETTIGENWKFFAFGIEKTASSSIFCKDYYAFGSIMPGRSFNSGSYRYSFQGQEGDPEIKGEGNSINYKFRMHDPRLGRFFAVDPLSDEYPWNSPYAFSENRVIDGVELEGLEYANATGGAAGPLTDKAATESGATLLPGFKSEADVAQEAAGQKQAEFQKFMDYKIASTPTPPQNTGQIKSPDLPAPLAMSKQIGIGIVDGLTSELTGLGVAKAFSVAGKIPVNLYRSFGGAGTEPSKAIGSYYTFINPKFYGKNYAKYAGLPSYNASTFTVKTRTTLGNLDFGSFGFAKPIGTNTGKWVPEIKVMNKDAVEVINLKVNAFTNPTYKPILPVKF